MMDAVGRACIGLRHFPDVSKLAKLAPICRAKMRAHERRAAGGRAGDGRAGAAAAARAATNLHVLALERKYEAQREQQKRREWVAARSAAGVAQGGGA